LSVSRQAWLIAAVVLSQLACVSTHVGGSTPVGGPEAPNDATLLIGDQRYRLDVCRSGDLEYFFGVDLEDRSDGAWVRLVIDPLDGPHLRVVTRNAESRVEALLGRTECPRLEAGLRHTGWRVNEIRDITGSLDAECRSDSGQQISVHARFAHCH
jgi:hypothetical protein